MLLFAIFVRIRVTLALILPLTWIYLTLLCFCNFPFYCCLIGSEDQSNLKPDSKCYLLIAVFVSFGNQIKELLMLGMHRVFRAVPSATMPILSSPS